MAMTTALDRKGGAANLDVSAIAAIAVTIIGWASAFPAIRLGLTGFGPVELGAIRFALAALPAILILVWRRPAFPARSEWWRFAFGGVFSVGLYTALLNYGELRVSAGAASFIVNINPILTALLAMTFLGERFGRIAWLGTAISVAGIGLIALGEGDGLSLNEGAWFILAGALSVAIGTIAQKPLFARHHPLTVTAWNMIIGAVVLSPALPSALGRVGEAPKPAVMAAVYLAFIPGFVAYGAWSFMLARLPAARATNFLYCVPPVATLIGIAVLGEWPTVLGIVGGGLALVGVVVVNLLGRPRGNHMAKTAAR